MAEHGSEARGIKIALFAYIVLFAIQLSTAFLTNLLILVAQSLETLSDVVVSAFLLLSVYWSRKPADEYHMFGHGRAQNVAALVAGTVMILFMGLEVFRESVPKLFESGESEVRDTNLGLVVLAASMIILAFPLIDILRGMGKGASVRAQKVQLLKDEFAYIPALGGIVLVGLGYPMADPLASIFIGVIILVSGLHIFKENVHYLVGKSPGKEFLDKVESTAKSVKGVLGVHDLKAEYIGPGIIHAGFHIEIARGTPIEEVDRITREVHDHVGRQTDCQDCTIHVDPARSRRIAQ